MRDTTAERELLEREMLAKPVSSLQYMLRQLSRTYHSLPQLVVDGVFGERTLEALLEFSREEGLAVNTGEAPELPGGAYVSDQGEAIMAYQNLTDRFKADYGPDKYPEWYGGAYIDERVGLVVNIAQGYEPEDKELFFQIQEWAGSDRVSFGSSRESLNYLRFLQDRALAAMEELGLSKTVFYGKLKEYRIE